MNSSKEKVKSSAINMLNRRLVTKQTNDFGAIVNKVCFYKLRYILVGYKLPTISGVVWWKGSCSIYLSLNLKQNKQNISQKCGIYPKYVPHISLH